MGTADDLEEFDADRELQLKREYADVFPIFRFGVATEDATYLCNELSVDCVPHGAFSMFEVRMSDVWVWDRNRPTRILPAVHLFTTGDVVVEQLKGDEGDLASVMPMDVLDQLRAQLAVEGGRVEDPDDDGAADSPDASE